VEDGLAVAGPNGPRPVAAADLPPAAGIWRQVLLEQPVLAQDLAWAALAAEQLPLALAHRLAGEAGPPPPASAAGLDRLAQVLAEAVASFAAGWPMGRPLRVLEVGACAGPLTARLAQALAGSGRRVVLTAATLPGQPPVATPMAALLPAIEFASVPWDPLGTAPPPLVADLIIGLTLGARLRIGAGLPAVLHQAAAPGAALLLAEPLPGRLWNFCCGQDPDWCGAAPLADPSTWAAALAEQGWDGAQTRPLRAAPWPALLVGARAAAGATLFAAPKLRRVALFADAAMAGLRPMVAAALQARGASVISANGSGGTLAEAAMLPPHGLAGSLVVVLAGGGAEATEIAASLAAIARLGAAAEGSASGFCIVTRGAQQDPAAAACAALGRVLANEHPGLKPRRIDLGAGLSPESAARRLATEMLTEADAEAEVTLAETGRLVPRLRPGLPPATPQGGPLRLLVGRPGQLGSLKWAPLALARPGPGEVVLRIEAAGLNFRDVMWAQGLLPEEALLPGFAGPNLGMECAGVVEAIGEGVELRLGQRVFGVAPAALATHALTRAAALAPLPDGLDPVAAATMPVAFMTAVHALEELARIEPGERVLIHGGAGAVGLAALQVALARGASVAASAGTAAKRAFLRAAGAELVLDSRDAGFADALRGHWPDGVDVVLNSLAGVAMERSLGLLRPFGRFLELGKRDFAEDSRVALRPLRRNATYFAVDIDELARARPTHAARLLGSIAGRLRDGAFRPLPATEYAAEAVEAAFRSLQASQHIGKLVIRPPALRPAATSMPPIVQAARGTILVVGGVQGFGLAAARWLATQGARHLALLSRRGMATPGAEAAIRDLAARGASATIHACDATDGEALARVLQAIRASAPPIRGVMHAAATAGDGAAALLEADRTARVLAAKLTVAEHLDRLTAEDPLALFLLFSSATVAIGNPGQAAYVAANAALEALARRRRAAGRPALAVGWGPIGDAGMLAGDAATAAILQRRIGATPMPAEMALAALPALLDADAASLSLARIAWATARGSLAALEEPGFEAIRGTAPPVADAADLQARLREADEAGALALLRETMAVELARILRLPPGAVSAEAPLAGLGLDSLGGMELRTALEQRLGMPVPLTGIAEGLNLEILARRIAAQMQTGQAEAEQGEAGAAALLALHEPRPAAGFEDAA
ncbi:MAG: hypothetical protein JWP04_1557, partial [Belnapia sp.]|nr:hypothetical protein [Belnapia sp.]